MILNFLDIICAIILFLSTALGAYAGAVSLSIGFIFFIASFVSTYLLFLPITDMLGEYISNSLFLSISSIALSYLLSALLCSFVAKTFRKLAEDISGGAADRFLGFVLGAMRGIIMDLIVFTIIIIITGHSYVGAKNIFDCIKHNPDTHYPNWVANSVAKTELRHLLDIVISAVGEDHLKALKLPEALTKEKPKEIERTSPTKESTPSDPPKAKITHDAFKMIEES